MAAVRRIRDSFDIVWLVMMGERGSGARSS